ncbi:MAG: hypothetical protein VB051_13515 [Candidatus Pelethousia sp.]|nr:hypothetical protein [Candidatus Pelethousia sp.]
MCTNTNRKPLDYPTSFDDLPVEQQQALCRWIKKNLRKRQTPLYLWTSYGLKHLFEFDAGFYIDNGAFKGAMLRCCFQPAHPLERNWCFGISSRSPAFKKRGL